MSRQIGSLQRPRVKRVEVIDADDGVAVGQETVENMGADKAGAAGEEDFHEFKTLACGLVATKD